MGFKILVSAPYFHSVLDRFRPILEARGLELVVPDVAERMDEAQLLELIGDIDGAICGDDQFTERVLRAAPKLKVISKWGTGIDSIDCRTCEQMGIAVRNTPTAFSDPVADTVLGYILCFARRLPWQDKAMKAGQWHKIPSMALKEQVLGVIGTGNVGKAVVHRAVAFGMRVVGHDLVEMPADFLEATGIEMTSKDALLAQADFVSINCDLNPTSRHLIDACALAQMKSGAVLINTARGPIVDQRALIEALQSGRLAGVALDVFEDEPLPVESPLRPMENALLAAHNSNSSATAWEHVHWNTFENLMAVLDGTDTLRLSTK